ncbi:calcium-binding protein [Microvirga aerilata]|uniref:Calcium-binding protein n=1 Tax=Microvirga aerilata TaxID=670292 RepID=A0A936Z738_9HYPH|nr:calcium-binding protein [Microvirga aerilata]MBL0404346.1 calcium-binding protein [Microvirga aerilata]
MGDFAFQTAIFDAAGKLQGSIRTIDDAMYNRAITPLPNGVYAVAYRQAEYNKLAFFGHDGAPVTPETFGAATDDLRGITGLSNGSVLSVAMSYSTPTSTTITAYLRGANGQTKTIALAEFESSSDMVEVITLANSNVVVVWCEDNALKARIVTAQGNVLGGEITLHQATSGSLEELKIEALPEGGFATAFVNRSSVEGVGTDVYLGIYSATGATIEAPSAVGRTTGSQSIPSIAVMKDGRFVVGWNDMEGQAMHFQAYDPRTKGVSVSGDDASDRFTGTGFDDALRGGGGADRLLGEGGNDILNGELGGDLMFGGSGNDTYYVDSLDDRIVEWANSGVDHVFAEVSQDLWDEVENLTASGAGAIILNGNELSNRITGNAGRNTLDGRAGNDALDGGAGADQMTGGMGDDAFYVDDTGDQVMEAQGGGLDMVYTDVSFTLSASQEIETLTAVGGAAVALKGNYLANAVAGNSAANKLWGGLGNDQLTGELGKDIFVFDTKAHKSTNKDRIVDFNVKDDTIWLDNKVFSKLGKKGSETKPVQLKEDFFVTGTKAKDKNDTIIYDKKKGVLLYDADGSGSKVKAVEVATLSKNLKLTEKDFFVI